AKPLDLGDDVLRRQAHVGEVEARQDVVVDAVDQHVAVVRLDLGGVQDEEPVAILQVAEVAPRIELAMLGQHDAVEWPLVAFALEQLQIRLDRRPAVVRAIRVKMEIENHPAGRNFARVTSGVTSSNTTSTGMPTRTVSGAHSTMFVMMRGP